MCFRDTHISPRAGYFNPYWRLRPPKFMLYTFRQNSRSLFPITEQPHRIKRIFLLSQFYNKKAAMVADHTLEACSKSGAQV